MIDAARFAEDVSNYLWSLTEKHRAKEDVRAGRLLPGVWRTVRDGDYQMRVRAWSHHAETTEPRLAVRRDATFGAVMLAASMMGG